MAVLRVKNREFQRKPSEWLQRAREGKTVVIISPEGPDLTLHAGYRKGSPSDQWKEHFEWLRKQPITDSNPVDELRRAESR
jgi:antitoxin (DNA-binding transcriptional repressor) of toxin-antitoxin stability system